MKVKHWTNIHGVKRFDKIISRSLAMDSNFEAFVHLKTDAELLFLVSTLRKAMEKLLYESNRYYIKE